ncbi:glutamate-rich protein 1 isoform X4 [Heliangelus exortis]|uniref:glutamate-rich protein 1 isoform X4 n=1 Tax=Heliangelus exortis TaxID=472823 RepID=UPI003A93AFE4
MALSRRQEFIQKVLKRLYPETSSSPVHTSSREEEAPFRNLGSKSEEKNLDNVQTSSADASISTDTPCKSFQGADNTVLSSRKMYTVNLPPEGYVAITTDANSNSVSENSSHSADSTGKSKCMDSAVNSATTQELLQCLEFHTISSSDLTMLHRLKSLILLQDVERLKDALKQFQEQSMMPPGTENLRLRNHGSNSPENDTWVYKVVTDSSCRKNHYQLIRHTAAPGSAAAGHVWDQYIQLQHPPANSTEEASLDPLSSAGTRPEK